MKTLVIIVSYNFERWIEKNLESLRRSKYPVDTIVIDNSSRDNTVARIREEYPEVRLIVNNENKGFGKANNQGIEIALAKEYDAVFLMNQDAWIEPDTIDRLVEVCKEHPNYGIISPVHLTGKGDSLDSGFAHYTKVQELSMLPKGNLVDSKFVNAAFWFIPITILKNIGGFCPLFYHYGEDVDFVNRLLFHGYKIGYCPQSLAHHDRDDRHEDYNRFMRAEYIYHLAECANIRYSLFKALGYGIAAVAKKSLTTLPRKQSLDYLRIMGKLLTKVPSIIKYRRINSKRSSHYL